MPPIPPEPPGAVAVWEEPNRVTLWVSNQASYLDKILLFHVFGKKVEEMLLTSEAFTRAVVDSISAHVCVLNREGVILKTNDAWNELAREHADSVFTIGEVGQKYFDLCRRTAAGLKLC